VVTAASVWVLTFTFTALPGAPSLTAETARQVPDQFSLEEEPKLKQYRAFRRMRATNEKYNQEAWLEAWTELDESSFRYEIVSEGGSEYIRNRVLKAVLEREREIIGAGQTARGDFSTANYEFTEAQANGRGVRYILLKPRRKDILLVDGRMVLNQDGTELLRVEGRLAKNPSFWTSLVNVIREFARLDGVRVPVAQESIAKLKFAGLSRMMVRYEYETINGRPVSLAARRTMMSAARGR
jgi:hypothetical protein